MEPYIKFTNEEIYNVQQYGCYLTNLLNNKLNKSINDFDVLDIGCGNGQVTFGLSPNVKTIYGVDPSSKMLKDAKLNKKKFGYNNIKFYTGSGENIPFTKQFDLLIFSNSLHFTQNINKSLENAFRNIKEGGYLFIKEPYRIFRGYPACKKINRTIYSKKRTRLRNTRIKIDKFIDNHNYTVIFKVLKDSGFFVILQKNA